MSSSYTLTLPPNYHRPNSSSYFTLSVPSPREWLARFARSSIQAFLSKAIKKGHLCIEDASGTYEYGRKSKSGTTVRMHVNHDEFWLKVFLSGDLGFSEAYMVGAVDVDDLKGAMDLWLDNQSEMVSLSGTFGQAYSIISGVSNALLGQTRSQARLNAMASYDQSNELFKAFLSEEMMYSCALWGPEEGGVNGDLLGGSTPRDLEVAQLRKIRHVLKKARVRPGHRILEFGSGWGGLAIEAARTFGCEVDSLTLSIEQKKLAEKRIRAAGLEGRVRIHLMDYRDIPAEFEHAFDAFISIEMLEHVGSQHYGHYFKLVDFALKPNNATVVVSSSTFPEGRYTAYQAEDFMRKYMWPNSCLPSATILVQAVQTSSRGRFTLESVENHAAHYPRTLRTWGRRLEANLRQEVVAREIPALQNAAEFAMFKRKWEYLFAYAGEGFARGYITCHMLTFTRADDPPIA